jgi:hypothetical protein
MARITGTNGQIMLYEHYTINTGSAIPAPLVPLLLQKRYRYNSKVVTWNCNSPWAGHKYYIWIPWTQDNSMFLVQNSFLTPIFTFIMLYLLRLKHIQVLYSYSTSNITIRDMYEWYHGSEPRTWRYPKSNVSRYSNCVLLMAMPWYDIQNLNPDIIFVTRSTSTSPHALYTMECFFKLHISPGGMELFELMANCSSTWPLCCYNGA